MFQVKDRVLLALSGGVDSVVMLHLFSQLDYAIGVAHCNFKLRGTESDEDESFCRKLAKELNVPIYIKTFDTLSIAKERGISVQMAARDLRYEWFKEVCEKEGFDYIATAHHLNDSVETFLVNFTKGCGLRGLHGIPMRNNKIIRPLLFATRKEMEGWATEHHIDFREDASNEQTKYIRNKIRHEVIPVLETINPGFVNSAGETINKVGQAEKLYDFAIEFFRQQVLLETPEGTLVIELKKLLESPAPHTLLFEFLRPTGLHQDQVGRIFSAKTGAVFYSEKYRFLVDRDRLICELTPNREQNEYFIEPGENAISFEDQTLELSNIPRLPVKYPNSRKVIFVDEKKLVFPLKVRGWKEGDKFKPFGMQGKSKKLKDFFNDIKLSLFEKERVRILEDAKGQIVWVIGYRADERFRIGEDTRKVLRITLL